MIFTAELPDDIVAKALRLAYQAALSAWTKQVQIFPCPTEALTGIDARHGDIRFYYPLRGGKWVITESESGSRFALTAKALTSGAGVLASSYPSALIPLLGHERPVSALDGDILIQCALFGTWKHKPHERETVKP